MTTNKIMFNKNYNNKLNNRIFTTIRKHTHVKENFFRDNEGEDFEIILRDNKIGTARLLGYHKKTWSQIQEEPITLLIDTGEYYPEAVTTIKKIYPDIHAASIMLVLIFERVI